MAEIFTHIDPIPDNYPSGLEEQVSEWGTRLIGSLLVDIARYLRLLGPLPLPSKMVGGASNDRLSVTITVQFERETEPT